MSSDTPRADRLLDAVAESIASTGPDGLHEASLYAMLQSLFIAWTHRGQEATVSVLVSQGRCVRRNGRLFARPSR